MGREMSDYIFGPAVEVWKSELDAINQEAGLLLAAVRQSSVEERRALQSQCAALIERRNTAIRNLLHSAFPRRHSVAPESKASPNGVMAKMLTKLRRFLSRSRRSEADEE